MFNCCCGGGTGTLQLDVSVCSNPATDVTVTITQTSGGSYTATMTGTSPIIFTGVPVGGYSYTITVIGDSTSGTTTVTAGVTTTITYSPSVPAGYFCGCCAPAGVYFPETLFLTSTGFGAVTLTWDGTSEWKGCQTISYPGYVYTSGACEVPATPTTLSITLCHSVSCASYSGGIATFTVGESWVIGTDFSPFPPPDGSIICPIPGGCTGNTFRALNSFSVSQACADPIDLSWVYTPAGFCGDLPIGTVTVTA